MPESLTSNEELSTYRDFWRKHALGPLERPSCLVCGRVPTEWPPGIQHGELPGIVVCTRCRDAGQRAAHETSGRIRPQERHAMFIASQCREVEQPARQLLADLYERSRHWPRADEPTPEKAKVSPAAVLQDDPSIPEGMCLCPHCGAVRTQEGCKLTDPSRCKFHASAQQAECAGCGFAHAPDYKDCVWLKNPY